jgi:hypothetical protein
MKNLFLILMLACLSAHGAYTIQPGYNLNTVLDKYFNSPIVHITGDTDGSGLLVDRKGHITFASKGGTACSLSTYYWGKMISAGPSNGGTVGSDYDGLEGVGKLVIGMRLKPKFGRTQSNQAWFYYGTTSFSLANGISFYSPGGSGDSLGVRINYLGATMTVKSPFRLWKNQLSFPTDDSSYAIVFNIDNTNPGCRSKLFINGIDATNYMSVSADSSNSFIGGGALTYSGACVMGILCATSASTFPSYDKTNIDEIVIYAPPVSPTTAQLQTLSLALMKAINIAYIDQSNNYSGNNVGINDSAQYQTQNQKFTWMANLTFSSGIGTNLDLLTNWTNDAQPHNSTPVLFDNIFNYYKAYPVLSMSCSQGSNGVLISGTHVNEGGNTRSEFDSAWHNPNGPIFRNAMLTFRQLWIPPLIAISQGDADAIVLGQDGWGDGITYTKDQYKDSLKAFYRRFRDSTTMDTGKTLTKIFTGYFPRMDLTPTWGGEIQRLAHYETQDSVTYLAWNTFPANFAEESNITVTVDDTTGFSYKSFCKVKKNGSSIFMRGIVMQTKYSASNVDTVIAVVLSRGDTINSTALGVDSLIAYGNDGTFTTQTGHTGAYTCALTAAYHHISAREQSLKANDIWKTWQHYGIDSSISVTQFPRLTELNTNNTIIKIKISVGPGRTWAAGSNNIYKYGFMGIVQSDTNLRIYPTAGTRSNDTITLTFASAVKRVSYGPSGLYTLPGSTRPDTVVSKRDTLGLVLYSPSRMRQIDSVQNNWIRDDLGNNAAPIITLGVTGSSATYTRIRNYYYNLLKILRLQRHY